MSSPELPHKEVSLPKEFTFSRDEAMLAARAVGTYADKNLRQIEAGWPFASRRAIMGTVDDLKESVDDRITFLTNCRNTMEKLSFREDDQYIEVALSRLDLVLTMNSLYSLAHFTTGEARRAITGTPLGTVVYSRPEHRQAALTEIGEIPTKARALYKKLEPTAREAGVYNHVLVWNDTSNH